MVCTMKDMVYLRVIFLGTAGSFPTINRNHPSIAIRRNGELILFDCGEGTQRQMFHAKLGFCHKIFVTHMHGDHVLGIPGLLQTMSLFDVKIPMQIFGPEGIHDFIRKIMEVVKFNLTFPLEIREVEDGIVCKEKDYMVRAAWMEHNIPSLAYALIENERPGQFYPEKALSLGISMGPLWFQLQHDKKVKLPNGQVISPKQVLGPPRLGLKIVYSGDTRPCNAIIELAKNADLLIHEATLDNELAEKAYESCHSTSGQAAEIAKKARVKQLVITHISARYDNAEILIKQAQEKFLNTKLAQDFMELEVSFQR